MMLTPFERWMVQQHLGQPDVADRVILLRAQGYHRVADAVELLTKENT